MIRVLESSESMCKANTLQVLFVCMDINTLRLLLIV